MSLVNLSHVCSHLQNASLARLGLTSIPYTRLHLSLSLLLQKQGFLSQVKLAGPSPPASCFPPGLRDSGVVTSHPHAHGRDSLFSPEAALQRLVNAKGSLHGAQLREEGFGEDATDFALTNVVKSKAQLERDGWDDVAARFLLRHEGKSRTDMQAEGLDEQAISIVFSHKPMLSTCRTEVRKWYGDEDAFEESESQSDAQTPTRTKPSFKAYIQSQVHSSLLREGFAAQTLQYFAGPQNSLVSARELAADGVTLTAMGQEIHNQPFNPPPPPKHTDPWDLEAEGVVTQANRASRRLWLGMKYWDGLPVLSKARMLSKPTKRIWLNHRDLGKLVRGNQAGEVRPLTRIGEIMAVSTDLGILEVRECVERRIGGMVLCRIY